MRTAGGLARRSVSRSASPRIVKQIHPGLRQRSVPCPTVAGSGNSDAATWLFMAPWWNDRAPLSCRLRGSKPSLTRRAPSPSRFRTQPLVRIPVVRIAVMCLMDAILAGWTGEWTETRRYLVHRLAASQGRPLEPPAGEPASAIELRLTSAPVRSAAPARNGGSCPCKSRTDVRRVRLGTGAVRATLASADGGSNISLPATIALSARPARRSPMWGRAR